MEREQAPDVTEDLPVPAGIPSARSRCAWCGSARPPVAVHGHVQCASCGINIDPCCGGEQACPPS
jgi:hypothetical protein